MGIRMLCLAAAAAVGVGQAGAATVRYDAYYTLTSISVVCDGGCERYPEEEVNVYAGIRDGQTAKGQLTITDDVPGQIHLEFRYGAELARLLFRNTLSLRADGSYRYAFADVRVSWDGILGVFNEWPPTSRIEQKTSVEFGILPAPIPLPASAALLPIGLAALTMIRRRRKSV